MYNDPQGSYPPPQPNNPQWNGNADLTQNLYVAPPQNPAPQPQVGGTANFPQGSFPPPTQNFPLQAQWNNGTTNFPQGSFPPQSPAPAQNGFVYPGPPRRSGLVPARSSQKSNLSMVMIGGATALALIVGLAFFVILSNQGQKSATPVVQSVATTSTTAADVATPTADATATPVSTPTLAPAPTAAIDTTGAYNPPQAAQQPNPAPTQMIAPTPKPTTAPVATPTAVPQTFTYDNNPVNGTLLTNPPSNFCAIG
ncbi:MAG: hypothetical protein NVS2B12_00010 [Ktedonobacteraceae bacterium]